MKLAETVGVRTKELLFKNNITQYRLTKLTCLNEKTISDILHARTAGIKFSTIYLISSAFGISIQEFLNSEIFNMENLEI